MKHHTCLARLTEVQVMPHNDIEKIVRSQSAIARRFDVVASDKKFLLAIRRREDAGLGIVGAIGKKLQGQKWMSGTAFSQVNLDSIRLPFAILRAHHHKIQ